ncbi:MAG: hypothetical protein RL427_676 [Bacteroidota bacterium]|jgi:hypothetical protein
MNVFGGSMRVSSNFMNETLSDQIYPHDGKNLNHFKSEFEFAFISFLPFLKIANKSNLTSNFKKFEIISFQEAKQNLDILENISNISGTIYSYSNINYPTDEEIFESAERINWSEVVEGANLENPSELNKALRTSNGALRKAFQKPALLNKLESFTNDNKIYHPVEGDFDILTKKKIYEILKILNKKEIIVFDEFQENQKVFDITKLTESEFLNEIESREYHIYSQDKEILFTIEWDSFFFIIAFNNSKNIKLVTELFEGFLCNPQTADEWDYKPGEFQKILRKENKKWWQFWI